jgi:hypothetical protein
MALLRRRLPAVVLAIAALLLLTSCVKLDVDLTVGTNDKVSGTYIVAIDRSLLQFTGQDADSIYQQFSGQFDSANLPEGATAQTEKYDEGDFVGAKITLDNLPIDSLGRLNGGSDQTASDDFSLTHANGLFQFHATIDTSDSDTSVSVPESVTANAEIRIKMTFPGEVTDTNGTKDGTSVTWEPKLGQSAELTATAKDSGGASSGGGSNGWLIALAIVAGLAVVVVVVIFLVAKGRREQAPPPPTPPPGPPPGLGSLTPPTAPTAAPPPAPGPPPGTPLPPPTS